jgi:hypothetical protein
VIARIVSLVVVLGVVAGCTPDEPEARPSGKPSTSGAPATTTTTSSTPLPSTPPPITRPLDPSRYATKRTVCDLLTDAQAIELGLPSPGDPYSLESFVSCTRHNLLADRALDYNLWVNSDVLDDTYGRGDDTGEVRPLDIEGQPAVATRADPSLACRVDVALAPRKGLEILADDHDQKACALAVTIAEQMVRNLIGGG